MERIKTGIPGLDDQIQGGLPKNYAYLICGGPGTGKSTFGIQFLIAGANQFDENGIHVSFEESPESTRVNMSQFGWDLRELENSGKLALIDAMPIRNRRTTRVKYVFKTPFGMAKFSLEDILALIHEFRRKMGAKRIVIDSLTALMSLYTDEFRRRREIMTFMKSLTEDIGCTVLMTVEIAQQDRGMVLFGEEMYLAQGVFFIHSFKAGEKPVLGLEILKMRGTKHQRRILLCDVTDDGFVVYPERYIRIER